MSQSNNPVSVDGRIRELGALLGRVLVLALVVAVVLLVLTQPTMATESGDEHAAEDGHADGASTLHLTVEGLQLLAGIGALGAVALAGQKFRGGHIELPLYVAGAGVAVFALQRLWHNVHEFGLLAAPSSFATQSLFLVALVLLAGGFVLLWDAMRSPV